MLTVSRGWIAFRPIVRGTADAWPSHESKGEGAVPIFGKDNGEATPGQGAVRLAFAVLVGLTIATYITFAVVAAMNTHNRIGLGGTPLFYDFSVFHQVAVLADT